MSLKLFFYKVSFIYVKTNHNITSTEVQVSRVIIALLLQNCFVWYKYHTHKATVQSLKLPDECVPCTIRNSSVAISDDYS